MTLTSLLLSPQLFLQRERAAVLAEAQTDDLIKEAPKPAADQSGQWQETGGEIQWVANDDSNNDGQNDNKKEEQDEEDEELDLNKGTALARFWPGSGPVLARFLTGSGPVPDWFWPGSGLVPDRFWPGS